MLLRIFVILQIFFYVHGKKFCRCPLTAACCPLPNNFSGKCSVPYLTRHYVSLILLNLQRVLRFFLWVQGEAVYRGRIRIAGCLVWVAPSAVLAPRFFAGFHRTATRARSFLVWAVLSATSEPIFLLAVLFFAASIPLFPGAEQNGR